MAAIGMALASAHACAVPVVVTTPFMNNGSYQFNIAVQAGQVYYIDPAVAVGIDAFRVGGIEISAGLDPANVTAFVTGMTFASDGFFTGTQTPITFDVAAVPEPESYALMLLGLGTIGFIARRRKAAAQARA